MDMSNFYLGNCKDGGCLDFDYFKNKSSTQKIIAIHKDTTTYIYEDVESVDIVLLFGLNVGNKGTPYYIRETGSVETFVKKYDCKCDYELDEVKEICAYDKDGDVLYSITYIDSDDNIVVTSEIEGKSEALKRLCKEIDGDEDVVRIEVL